MSELKHTPGPWEWWTSNSFLRLSSRGGKDGGVIDSFKMSDGHTSLSVNREDMALIAAAPDLLEALQLLLKQAQSRATTTYPEWHGAVNKARAAISKATGE